MNLLLSGQLGFAQLGAAELGALQTVTVGAGFLPIFPDVGPLKQAEPPKKKKAKKPKKVKRPKKQKKPKRVKLPIATASESASVLIPAASDAIPAEPILETKSVDTAQDRLRETIAEEDELLLLIC